MDVSHLRNLSGPHWLQTQIENNVYLLDPGFKPGTHDIISHSAIVTESKLDGYYCLPKKVILENRKYDDEMVKQNCNFTE
jgi:hypothetical protein